MTSRGYTTTTGIVFGLVALAHLIRVVTQSDFMVGGWSVPSWVSLIAVAVAGYLSFSGLRLGAASR